MLRMIVLSLLLFSAPAWAADVLDTKALAALPNLANPAPNIATAGAVQSTDIAVIAGAGIRHVIDLRVDGETPDFDEAVAVRAAGMAYHNLPIRGAEDLTPDNAAHFDRLIHEAGAAPTLIHCTSSNRVGALAEAEDHHPDIELGWGRVALKIWTHSVGGLSRNDFILAAKIDETSG